MGIALNPGCVNTISSVRNEILCIVKLWQIPFSCFHATSEKYSIKGKKKGVLVITATRILTRTRAPCSETSQMMCWVMENVFKNCSTFVIIRLQITPINSSKNTNDQSYPIRCSVRDCYIYIQIVSHLCCNIFHQYYSTFLFCKNIVVVFAQAEYSFFS